MRSLRIVAPALALALSTGCLTLSKERRLAEPDQNYRVEKLVVMPVMLAFHYCPDDVDKRARKDELLIELTSRTIDRLKTRGYTIVPLMLDPEIFDPKLPANRDLGKALCDGSTLETLPESVARLALDLARPSGAKQVYVGGIARMRWHLRMDLGDDNGSKGDQASEFEVRAVGAIYDIPSGRVVWNEYVDTKFFTGDYNDAVNRVLLFDELHGKDPHEKLFYDFPLSISAPAPK